MEEEINVYIAGINCTFEDAIREASKGSRVIILHDIEQPTDKPSIELINFTQDEAMEFYECAESVAEGNVELKYNYI